MIPIETKKQPVADNYIDLDSNIISTPISFNILDDGNEHNFVLLSIHSGQARQMIRFLMQNLHNLEGMDQEKVARRTFRLVKRQVRQHFNIQIRDWSEVVIYP